MDTIKRLTVTHQIGGRVHIVEERIAKISRWSVPKGQKGVREFIEPKVTLVGFNIANDIGIFKLQDEFPSSHN